ncbi:YcaO-like family protein [Halococcus agarilyticus]|uniref:YcaO-like family protein n=1 Tax=Halococcus agarilyticus TaxID=1232219 RepID=UPI0006778995|nr:YcaO-like family protein [Halococcus agarilyticus]
MNVGIVGSGPAADAVRAALAEADATVESIDPVAIDTVDLGIVVDDSGAECFERANDHARESATPWLAIERGGVGGRAVCEASITGFGPETACYECLSLRVAANADSDGDSPEDDPDGGEADESGIDATAAWLAGALAGTEARRLCAGEPSRVLGGVIELPHAERRVLPVPNCECASDEEQDRSLARDFEERDLDDALARAERALDDRVGIVREVGEAASYPAPYYLARTGDTAEFSDASAAGEAAGVAGDWNAAFMKALGEALERYSAGIYRDARFTHATASDLDGAIPPGAFVLPGSAEPATDESERPTIPWVPGEEIVSGASVHLPAELVQFPPPERRHGPPITTGLGLGSSGAEALCSGLYEAIERDAAMVSWYSTFDPLGLVVDDEGFSTLAARARSEGLRVHPVLLTQDVDIPVVAVAVERDEWPRFAVGSAADLDPTAAARSALAEALQNWMELRAMGPEAAAAAEGAIGEYAETPGDAATFFGSDAGVPAASVGPDPTPTGADELDSLAGRVTDAGLDAYAARLTPRDVEELGFEAVRVLVPAAQPLFTDEPYFGERAERVPRESGFEPRLDREFHPYP